MNTTQTDAIMALADAYAIEVAETSPPLTTLERSLAMTKIGDARIALREALLAALQAREGEAVAWHHGCNVLCADIDLWIDRCPHCGKPRPAAPAPQPAQPSEPAQPVAKDED